MIEYWRHSVVHPALADCLNVAAYAIAAALCGWAAARARVGQQIERVFWGVTCGLLLMSGANEILDLQTLLTAIGRLAARNEGWYAERRAFQLVFAAIFASLLVMGAVALAWRIRRLDASIKLASAGLVAIGIFAALRAATFLHAGPYLAEAAHGVVWANRTESAGIAAIAVAALVFGRNRGPNPSVEPSVRSKN